MLELVNAAQRKPRARSPSIGLIVQRTLPIGVSLPLTGLLLGHFVKVNVCDFINVITIVYGVKQCFLFSMSIQMLTMIDDGGYYDVHNSNFISRGFMFVINRTNIT